MVRGVSLDGEDLELPYEDLELPVSHGEPKDSQRLPYDAADTERFTKLLIYELLRSCDE